MHRRRFIMGLASSVGMLLSGRVVAAPSSLRMQGAPKKGRTLFVGIGTGGCAALSTLDQLARGKGMPATDHYLIFADESLSVHDAREGRRHFTYPRALTRYMSYIAEESDRVVALASARRQLS